ncbi:haptoglobin-like [Scomber scombrus]|uniref:Haptoglobin-like n=2 Tax=Scomber scombrus TaxID=13677 RepID=A0AAV1PPW9_SCOSC
MVYLSDSILDGGFAGGALISDRWVLTAGRNLFVRKTRQDTRGKTPLIPKVYLGILGRVEAGPTTEFEVEKVVLHPGFQNKSDWDNDLALIQLKKPVVMSDKVTPIPLPERGQDVSGPVIITGWGWGIHFTPASSLKHLVLSLATNSLCRSEYGTELRENSLTPFVDDNMFCTSKAAFDHNVCFGDAGGALIAKDPRSGEVYAAGILSYDKACSDRNYGVYMKISSYLHWIHSVTRGDTDKSSALRAEAMDRMIRWQQAF